MNIGGSASITQASGNLVLSAITAGTIVATASAGAVNLPAGASITATGPGNALQLTGTSFVNNQVGERYRRPRGAGWCGRSTGGRHARRPGFSTSSTTARTFGITTPALATGNALLYSNAPAPITPALAGTVTRQYDATVLAPLSAANFAAPTLLAVDTPSITFGAASYADQNAARQDLTATGIGLS